MARKLLAALVLGAVVPVTLTVTDKKKLKFSASVTGADAVAHDVVDSGGSIRRFSDVDTVVKGVLDNRASVTSVDVTIDTTEVKKQRIPTDPVAEATRLKTKYTSAKATAVSTKAKIDANLLQIAVYQTSGVPEYVARYDEVVATQTAVADMIVWYDAQIAIQDAIITP